MSRLRVEQLAVRRYVQPISGKAITLRSSVWLAVPTDFRTTSRKSSLPLRRKSGLFTINRSPTLRVACLLLSAEKSATARESEARTKCLLRRFFFSGMTFFFFNTASRMQVQSTTTRVVESSGANFLRLSSHHFRLISAGQTEAEFA